MNKCFKCKNGTDPNSVPTIKGDLVYISGNPFVYLHDEDENGNKKLVPIEKTSFN